MKFICLCLLSVFCAVNPVWAADDKIDPETYICAELVAANLDGQPPLFEGLQLDGYYSAKKGKPFADAAILAPMLIEVADSCASEPADKALTHWEMARKNHPESTDTQWNADTYTCADYVANPDDGSGFVIWLDAYNRGKTGKTASILSSQEAIDTFVAECKANPKKLMKDMINQTARD